MKNGNIEKFIQLIYQTGGASYNLATGYFNPLTGYMVSMKGCERVSKRITKMGVKNFILSFIEKILNDDSIYIGCWKHKGEYYLDLSYHFSDKSEAMQFARDNEQIAIWDCDSEEEIKL